MTVVIYGILDEDEPTPIRTYLSPKYNISNCVDFISFYFLNVLVPILVTCVWKDLFNLTIA